ncbi:MAG: putative Ig domain-containing protein, partial [Bacteroidales bacterium]|nr:putative Ig domain-containing protein [Bacteroidales bacterium]
SGQGFFVKATATGTLGKDDQFTIPKTARTHTTHTFWKSGKALITNLFRMNLSKDGFKDETVLWTVDGSTEGHDGNFDLHKRFSMDLTKPQIYTFNNNGNLFALNAFPLIGEKKEVAVGVNIGAAGTYSINFTENNYDGIHIYLEDKLNEIMTNTRSSASYTFASEAANFQNRFILHFNPNNAPVINGTIMDQSVNEDENYVFTTTIDFSDEDFDDKVSISAQCPEWLSFNPSTKTFSGTPVNSNVGSHIIKLTGTDLMNAKTEVSFNIVVLNVNDAPTLANAMADQIVNEKTLYSFTIPANSFIDIDLGDKLSFSATLSDGSALPSWLIFDENTATFSGTSAGPCVLNIKLTASDNSGASVSDMFMLEVLNVNDAPELSNAIPDQEVAVSSYYSYTIPGNTFTDADADDQMVLTVAMANGDPLPNWLTFDAQNWKLYGISDYPGDLLLQVTAIDSNSASASDEFLLSVKSVTGINKVEENQVKVSPNPTKGKFIILVGSISENFKYSISDYNGKHIKNGKITLQATEIDMTDYADGVYFIELNNGKESSTHKLILNK